MTDASVDGESNLTSLLHSNQWRQVSTHERRNSVIYNVSPRLFKISCRVGKRGRRKVCIHRYSCMFSDLFPLHVYDYLESLQCSFNWSIFLAGFRSTRPVMILFHTCVLAGPSAHHSRVRVRQFFVCYLMQNYILCKQTHLHVQAPVLTFSWRHKFGVTNRIGRRERQLWWLVLGSKVSLSEYNLQFFSKTKLKVIVNRFEE